MMWAFWASYFIASVIVILAAGLTRYTDRLLAAGVALAFLALGTFLGAQH